MRISIHALLAESDLWVLRKVPILSIFLSTLSLRRATSPCVGWLHIVYNFYPRSPCGERQSSRRLIHHLSKFLSTLSLRRATACQAWRGTQRHISIHALLAESDPLHLVVFGSDCRFLSTLSLRRATHPTKARTQKAENFYPRSPCGERLSHCPS